MPETDLMLVPLSDLMSLDGRAAVVTGAAQNIGHAVARRLAAAGARVWLADRRYEQVATVDLEGTECVEFPLDVADIGSVAALEADVRSSGLPLGAWLNVAGIYPAVPFAEMTPDAWEGVFQVNVVGSMLGAQAAARLMAEHGAGGTIVNVTSASAFRAMYPGIMHYAASKAALTSMTRNLAMELAPSGIRVLAIAPGYIPRGEAEAADAGEAPEEVRARNVTRQPLNRTGTADDVARVALFAVSGLADFMTGHTLYVEGGLLAC